jgi:hypothetical protein
MILEAADKLYNMLVKELVNRIMCAVYLKTSLPPCVLQRLSDQAYAYSKEHRYNYPEIVEDDQEDFD